MNFNTIVLYAPSDWKDEANFFRLATAKEKAAKIEQEIAEERQDTISRAKEAKEVDRAKLPSTGDVKSEPAIIRDPVRLQSIENAALARASKEYGSLIKEQLVVDAAGRKVLFDGIAKGKDRNWAFEIKFISRQRANRQSARLILEREIERFDNRKLLLPASISHNLGMALVIVFEAIDNAERSQLKAELQAMAVELKADFRLELYAMEDMNIQC